MQILKRRSFAYFTCLIFLFAACTSQEADIRGELKKWHRIELVFDGPESSELDENNPFTNYRLDVTFRSGDQIFQVPGFYAADGQAAESSAESGDKWAVRFTPNRVGQWTYEVSFKQGPDIAIAEADASDESAGFMNGVSGSFIIADSDKTGVDNRAAGRLKYIGERYLQYKDAGTYFIKVGVDAPENLLAYDDIDATPNVLDFRKDWNPHAGDYDAQGDAFLWQGQKGKNLMGAIKYLASENLNVFSFLTFNVDGDDRNVFPHLLKVSPEAYEQYANDKKNVEAWENHIHKTRFDVSKLAQWERILAYAELQGMFLHFKTHETETDHLMDKGVFGKESKLYYRELIARFGHHLAMNWNLGEENNQPIAEVIKAAEYVHTLDPYKHHLVIHTFPNDDDRYASLVGDQSPLTGASLQLRDKNFRDVHQRVLKWRDKSEATGKSWALAVDEPGNARYALLPDAEDMKHDSARSHALWGTLMASGFGVEWYFGYNSPHSDLTCEDFRSRDLFWDQNRHARHFFENHIPFWEMNPADDLTSDTSSYCLASTDKVYAVYRQRGGNSINLNLGESGKQFSVSWFDPRNGGELQSGTVPSVAATGTVSLGSPPTDEHEDWVILIRTE